METLLRALVERQASDLHVSVGSPPIIRHDGEIKPLPDMPRLSSTDTQQLLLSIAPPRNREEFERRHDTDFAYEIPGLARFRCNLFVDRLGMGGVFRVIPHRILTAEEMGLPTEILDLCRLPKGLVLVTGPTGSGKSTSLAAMIDHINATRALHIVTVEDPIEFLHRNKSCLVNQREIGSDTQSFKRSLRSALREDPDVVLVGEMRDIETIEAALTIAETGHLTFATLHTSDCVQTINRVVDVFPAHQQQQVRTQLSFSLQAVLCQQLIPSATGRGRVLALETMIANSAIRSLIRDDKAHQIYSIIQTGGKLGMRTMNQSLHELCRKNLITYDDALAHSGDIEDLKRTFARA